MEQKVIPINESPAALGSSGTETSVASSGPVVVKGSQSATKLPFDMTKLQKRVFKIMDNGYMQSYLISLLFLSLFMADAWTVGNAKDSQNDGLYAVLTAVFVTFCLESLILSLVQPNYFLSFFFFMDVLGTISIILDIQWISQGFLPSGSSHQSSVLRATRAAKLGARYGRLMRLLKLLRFMKYMPCLKGKDEDVAEPSMSSVRKVSNQLSTVLSQRVAGLVMLLVIVVPFLSYNTVAPGADTSVDAFIAMLKAAAKSKTTNEESMLLLVHKFHKFYHFKDQKLLSISIESPYLTTSPYTMKWNTREALRVENTLTYNVNYRMSKKDSTTHAITVVMDVTQPNQWDSGFGIILIVLVICVLVGFSASFQNAVDALVVVPLEKMVTALRNSATVMLKSMKAMDKEKEKDENKKTDEDDEDEEGELETQMLEKMVEKLARIVAHVMPGGHDLDMTADKNVDKATANWLAQTYSQNFKKVEVQQATVSTDEGAERKRLQSLKSLEIAVSSEVLNSWEFDVLEYSNEQLCDIFAYLFAVLNIFEEFKCPTPVFNAFIAELASKYINTNTYHNFKHGCDVGHTVYRLIMTPQLNLILSHLEVFSMLVAAIGHDVGHMAVNNAFLVKSKHELAILHNDRSPLENMHCSVVYEMLKKPSMNIFVGLSEQQWRDSRKLILACILGTDMAHHFEQISKTQLFLEVNGEDVKQFCSGEKETIDIMSQEKDRLFVMEIILHSADISNPYKPWRMCSQWAVLVVEEFCAQGDQEMKLFGEISPMFDRATINLVNMQLGFIEFVVAPLIIGLVNIFPPLHESGAHMRNNYTMWGERRKEDISKDEKVEDKAGECKKIDERVAKFREKMSFVEVLKALPQRKPSAWS